MIIKDKSSREWIQVKKFCESELSRLRKRNDNSMDLAETENIRGQIAFAKRIINLDKVETIPNIAPGSHYVD